MQDGIKDDTGRLLRLLSSRRVGISLTAALSIAAYLNSLGGGFVYDDAEIILNNPWIRDIRNLPLFFTQDTWAYKGSGGGSNYYRPFWFLVLMADYHLFGLEPWGFRLTHVVLHAVVTMAVFLFASIIISGDIGVNRGINRADTYRWAPFMAALLFATHPVHTMVVVGNGSHEMGMALFVLLALYFYVQGRHVAGAVCFLCSAFFKETAMVLPAILIAWDASFKKGFLLPLSRDKLAAAVKRYVPYLSVAALYMTLRTYALGGFTNVNFHEDLTFYEYLINVPPLFAKYMWMLLVPTDLSVAHTFYPVHSLLEWRSIAALVVLAAYLAALAYLYRSRGTVFFLMMFMVLPLLPVFYIPGLGVHVFAENYLYLPGVAFAVLSALLAFSLIGKLSGVGPFARTVAAVALVATITLVYAAGTVKRIPVWKDNLSLWEDTARKSPADFIVINNLAAAYYDAGMLEEALARFKAAARLRPDLPRTHNHMGLIYAETGDDKGAVTEFEKALQMDGDYSDARYNLATLHLLRGRVQRGVAGLKEVLSRDPSHFPSVYSLATTFKETGDGEEAIKWYQKALSIKPSSVQAHNNLGILYGEMGRYAEAVAEFEAALEYDPAFTDAAHNLNYTNKLMKTGGGASTGK